MSAKQDGLAEEALRFPTPFVWREAVLERAGRPVVPLFNFMHEASVWADLAGPNELDAYCLASFNRMERAHQIAFLSHAQRAVA
jgi:hypothetical protein